MVLEECRNIISRFKRRFTLIHKKKGEQSLESQINSGWCYVLAFVLKLEISKYDNQCDIVRSFNHWFFRIRHNGEWVYFDAFMSEGTTELLDITDNTPNKLEVWGLDDVLSHLNAERVLNYVGLTE